MSDLRNVFVVKNIRATNVNLIMNDFAAGLPSPLSFLGLADLLARNLGLTPWSARVIPSCIASRFARGARNPKWKTNRAYSPRSKPWKT